MGFDPHKGLAKSYKAGNVENRVWCELVKLHTINENKPTKELVGRERKSVWEKIKEHYRKAAQGLGNAISARESDLIIGGDEAIGLGFLQILLLELRWYPAGCKIRSDTLAHLVLLRASLDAHLGVAHGGYAEAQKGARSATMVAAVEARKLVNSNSPTLPLYSFLRKERGLRRGTRSGNGSPLTGREIVKLLRCP
jgi:hypothetical protein